MLMLVHRVKRKHRKLKEMFWMKLKHMVLIMCWG